MTTDPDRLEAAIGRVLQAGVVVSAVCLAAGLSLFMLKASEPAAMALLRVGVVALLATPGARVFASMIEYAVGSDWMFATLTLIVLVELLASVAVGVYGR